jgi:hypothetical protein
VAFREVMTAAATVVLMAGTAMAAHSEAAACSLRRAPAATEAVERSVAAALVVAMGAALMVATAEVLGVARVVEMKATVVSSAATSEENRAGIAEVACTVVGAMEVVAQVAAPMEMAAREVVSGVAVASVVHLLVFLAAGSAAGAPAESVEEVGREKAEPLAEVEAAATQ